MSLRGNEQYRGDFSDVPFKPGDIIIVYGPWEIIEKFKRNEDFILATLIKRETPKPFNALKVGLIMAGVLTGVITGIKLPVVLFSGVVLIVSVLYICFIFEKMIK
jgi:hypothetical protein